MKCAAAHLRYLGCKQNLGHPVNDLFNLRMEVQPQETHSESPAGKESAAVETVSTKA